MTCRSERGLRILLFLLALDAAVGGLLMLFGGKALMMRMFPYPPESEISTLLLLMRRERGGLGIAISVMLYFAGRNPSRNVAILYALIVGLCIVAVTALVSLYTGEAARIYPAYSVWLHSLARFGVAALLFYLRPREGSM